MVDLTPRERHVLEALQLGLPNKLIAVRLNLSEDSVKMHIQHIMRKCYARNHTEAVFVGAGKQTVTAVILRASARFSGRSSPRGHDRFRLNQHRS